MHRTHHKSVRAVVLHKIFHINRFHISHCIYSTCTTVFQRSRLRCSVLRIDTDMFIRHATRCEMPQRRCISRSIGDYHPSIPIHPSPFTIHHPRAQPSHMRPNIVRVPTDQTIEYCIHFLLNTSIDTSADRFHTRRPLRRPRLFFGPNAIMRIECSIIQPPPSRIRDDIYLNCIWYGRRALATIELDLDNVYGFLIFHSRSVHIWVLEIRSFPVRVVSVW